MAPRDFTETIISYSFRCSMLFGLSTHLYDRQARRLVFSLRACIYSAALHVSEVALFPSAIKVVLASQREELKRVFFVSKFFFLVLGMNILTFFVAMLTQWTTRAKAPQLFNEILEIWRRDLAPLQSSAEVRRTAGRLFLLKAVSTGLIMANTFLANLFSMNKSLLSLAGGTYAWILMNTIVVVQYQLGLGLIFGVYLFEVLNWNLLRIVSDVNRLGEAYSSRWAHRLSRELLVIGQLHRRLQKWVVSLNDLFQVEFLLILVTFFISQVGLLFFLVRSSVPLWKTPFSSMHSQLLFGVGNIFFATLDLLVIFYICGRVISSSCKAGEILKGLPANWPSSKALERSIETVCFELQREKIRLSVCGLADLDGNTGFAMTEAAMMQILLLIQIDYDHF